VHIFLLEALSSRPASRIFDKLRNNGVGEGSTGIARILLGLRGVIIIKKALKRKNMKIKKVTTASEYYHICFSLST
jgi:hypothetical protein